MLHLDARGKRVLIISDTHCPYSHPYFLPFLYMIKTMLEPDIIIHIGDESDFHGMSFHDKEVELFSAGHELEKAIEEVRDGIQNIFPKVYLLESNHGSMIMRKAKHHQIPIAVLKPLPELYQCPGFSWHEEILLDTNFGPVYLCHGKTGGYGKLMKDMGVSAIQGHFHGKFEITYHKTTMGTRFNMFVGCLVDYNSLAMRYGRNNIPKPILGCGWIDENGIPKLIPMLVNEKNEWIRKLTL